MSACVAGAERAANTSGASAIEKSQQLMLPCPLLAECEFCRDTGVNPSPKGTGIAPRLRLSPGGFGLGEAMLAPGFLSGASGTGPCVIGDGFGVNVVGHVVRIVWPSKGSFGTLSGLIVFDGTPGRTVLVKSKLPPTTLH